MSIEVIKGDCLEVMKSIPEGSIDAIITDPPYGTTACKWDSVIPFDLMWEQLNRIIKPNGAIVLFGSEPFSSALRMSNIKNYKYDWVWHKNMGGNFMAAKKQPMKQHENISVFYRNTATYNFIKEKRLQSGLDRVRSSSVKGGGSKEESVYGKRKRVERKYDDLRYPQTVQKFKVERGLHPTQKPVALMEYLIKTYTNENETVLDFTMGSGSTGVAAKNLNRKFIGIEMDENYFNIASDRIKQLEYKLL
jgi:site-specific DNA-methyltransferase (adenine-specific)